MKQGFSEQDEVESFNAVQEALEGEDIDFVGSVSKLTPKRLKRKRHRLRRSKDEQGRKADRRSPGNRRRERGRERFTGP